MSTPYGRRRRPHYYGLYEKRFELPVHRPVHVPVVCDRGERLAVETPDGTYLTARARQRHRHLGAAVRPLGARAERFEGRQLHTRDYRGAQEFEGRHVIVVGGGISAVQLLDEISCVTTTTWVTRREPRFREEPFTPEIGRAAVALVEDRVRRGLPPGSVVSVTGLPVTPAIRAARERGVLHRSRCSPRSPKPASAGPTAPNDVPTSSCGARVFGRRSTISRRCGYAVPAEASR